MLVSYMSNRLRENTQKLETESHSFLLFLNNDTDVTPAKAHNISEEPFASEFLHITGDSYKKEPAEAASAEPETQTESILVCTSVLEAVPVNSNSAAA